MHYTSTMANACVAFIAVALLPCCIAHAQKNQPATAVESIKNLNAWKVDDNIYRSAQPKTEDFKEFASLGVKSVLNLRYDSSDDLSQSGNSMVYYQVPIDYRDVSTDRVIQAMRLVRQSPKPLLIHCQAGADRTGLIVALYRMLFDNWSKDDAYAEMRSDKHYNTWPAIDAFIAKIDDHGLEVLRAKVFSDSLISLINSRDDRWDSLEEISALAVYKGNFVLVSERDKMLQLINGASFRFQNAKKLDVGVVKGRKVQFEAAAVYGNHLLLTDEEEGKIYDYNFNDGLIYYIQSDFDFRGDKGKFGIEGIAVNAKKGKCYVLKERNDNWESVIREFSISENKGRISMKLIDTIVIKHPKSASDAGNNWRYSDLVYDEPTTTIYALRTFYNFAGNRGSYLVDSFKTNAEGLVSKKLHRSDTMRSFVDITKDVNLLKSYNTNLEGLAVFMGNLYAVSDNGTGKRNLFLIINRGLRK